MNDRMDPAQLDEYRKVVAERMKELERIIRVLDLYKKSCDQDIVEIQTEIELLKEHIQTLNKKALSDLNKGYAIDATKKWRSITRKYNDAKKFYNLIVANSKAEGSTITPETLEQVTEIFQEVVKYYNSINSILNKQYGSYNQLKEQFEKETDPTKKEELKDKLDDEENALIKAEINFDYNYQQLITFESLSKTYKEFSKKEIQEKLKKENIDLKNTKGAQLATSKENLDRAKLLIYVNQYKQQYDEGKAVSAPYFHSLSSFYNEDKTIDVEKFPEFFKELTGVDFSHLDVENDVKQEEARKLLGQYGVDSLEGHELRQLKIDLVEEEIFKEEEKAHFISYISEKEHEEREAADTPKKKLKLHKKTVINEAKRSMDPYLKKDPAIQERARAVHDALYLKILGEGDIMGGIIALTRLPDIDSMRFDLPDLLKEYTKRKYNEAKTAAINKVIEKIDESEIGARVRAGGKKVVTSIVNKSKFVEKHRKKAKKQGLGLLMYAIRKMVGKTIGKIVDITKTTYRAVRNSKSVVKVINSLKGTSLGQSLQKFATASIDLTKSTYNTPKELMTKGRLVYKNVLKKPLVVGAMDTGYIAKTAFKKIPKGIFYGTGLTSIALSLGASGGAILPIFAIGTALGVGLETASEIMNNPTTRVLSRPLRWLQSHGSAVYKDPVSKAFSSELVDKSKAALEGKQINVYGTTGGRLFGAARSGLSAAMIAASIAGLLGFNPLLAAGLTFGVVTSAKFGAQTVAGKKVAESLAGKGLSRFGLLPLNRIMGNVYNLNIVSGLIMELSEWLKSGRSLGDFWKKNFTFGQGKSALEKFNNFNNYFGTLGYFFSNAGLLRYVFGNMLFSRLTTLGVSSFFGSAAKGAAAGAVEGAATGAAAGGVGLIRAGLLALRGAFGPVLIFTAASIAGLAIAAALGVPIGGLGAAIGATVGGLVGTGIGLILGQGVASIPLAAVLNLVGTGIGAWIGSFFDKAVDGVMKGMFAIMGGISFLFTLIDILNNKSLNPKRLAMASVSLALTMPALGAVINKGSVSQVQADPTLPTPTTVVSYYNNPGENASLAVINQTNYKLDEREVEKLTSLIKSELITASGINTYLIFSDTEDSKAFVEDDTVMLTVSVKEYNPGEKVSRLISNLNLTN